MDKYEYRSGVI